VAEESGQSEQPPEQPVEKRKKVPLEVREQRLAPKPSLWPIGLALALVIAFIGVMINPIILAVGVVLVIASIIGWMLEKH
jgi:cytochrome c oxidase subunit IV